MGSPVVTREELAEALRAVQPEALLVSPRLLRRAIRRDHPQAGAALHVAHRKCYVCERDRLIDNGAAADMGLPDLSQLPERVILIANPRDDALGSLSGLDPLVAVWRLLFHSRIHLVFDQKIAAGVLGAEETARRIARIGACEWAEIHQVLHSERFLLEPDDECEVLVEFASIFLEFRRFEPGLVSCYFPAIEHPERIEALLAEDVDADAIMQATRLAGTPGRLTAATDPGTYVEIRSDAVRPPPVSPPWAGGAPAPRRCELRLRQADKAAEQGNVVRAAIRRTQAARASPGQRQAELRQTAHGDVDRLALRLQAALELDDTALAAWQPALAALLEPAAARAWPPAARILYDLQKLCVHFERPRFEIRLLDWLVSLGQEPLHRPLPGLELVLALKYLRRALSRVTSARLGDADRRSLAGLLTSAIAGVARCLRQRFRPVLLDALHGVGLEPQNLPEHIARDKLVEELLDRIDERGHLKMSDLRDGLSRNQLKLADLAGPGELLSGDPLLRFDRRLADSLAGMYRPGEIYLRWLQKLSSLAFGTWPGRLLTLFIALPFGGAFVVLEGLDHIVNPIMHVLRRPAEVQQGIEELEPLLPAVPPSEHKAHDHIHLLNPYSLAGLGLFLVLMLHWPAFRQGVAGALWWLWRAFCLLLYDLPAAFFQLPSVQTLLSSRPARELWRFLLLPLLMALPLSIVFPLCGLTLDGWLAGLAGTTVLTSVFVNTRLGRDLEEVAGDWLAETWLQIHTEFLPGMFRWIMHFFKVVVEEIERLLYTVDEWLLFRSGDGRLSLALKVVFGALWGTLAYVVRFCVNLLIEPQINPIKHFPVVTVSHKLVLSLGLAPLIHALSYAMDPAQAVTLATAICFSIPGIFGFLVWELKENWKLYRSNRARTLRPVVIGSHGETMLRFLRPGFHSGTLPKLFAKLRQARRRAQRTNYWKPFRKQRDALHHVEESLERFLERDFLTLLNHSKSWDGPHVTLGNIGPATNVVRIELRCADLGTEPVHLAFALMEGRLTAQVVEPGWSAALPEPRRRALALALAGLYRLTGVQHLCNGAANSIETKEIAWQDWVNAWEQDQACKEIPQNASDTAQNL